MKGVTAEIPETACPQCSLSIGLVVGVTNGPPVPPRRGNYAVCHNCGALLRFAEGLALELVDVSKVNVPPSVLAEVYRVQKMVGDLNEDAAAKGNRRQRRGTEAQIRRRGRIPS